MRLDTLMSLTLAACLLGCTDAPTDKALIKAYAANREAFDSIVSLCQKNSGLKSIELRPGASYIRPSELSSTLNTPAEAFLSKVAGEDTPQQIDCIRHFTQGIGRLTAVRFSYFGARFGLRRNAISLHRELSSPNEWLEGALKSGELRQTGIKDWYLYEVVD